VPGHADFAVRVAGFEQAEQLGAALVVEAFVGAGEQRRQRYSGSVLWLRWPRVSFWTRRRTSSSLVLASFTR